VEAVADSLVKMIGADGFKDWARKYGLNGQRVLEKVLEVPDSVQQVEQLMADGVLASVREIAGIISNWYDRSVGEAGTNIFDDIVKSKSILETTTRALKLISALLDAKVSRNVLGKIVRIGIQSSWNDDDIIGFFRMMNTENDPVDGKKFEHFRVLWRQSKTLDEYKFLLNSLVHLVNVKRDFTFSFAFLQAKIDAIAKAKVRAGEQRVLTPLEKAVIEAVNETGEKDILLPFLLREDFSVEFREYLLGELSGVVLDGELPSICKIVQQSTGTEKFWSTFIDIHQRFGVYSPAVMMEYLFNGRITLDELESLRSKVEGLTFPELLTAFASEGKNEDKILLTYFIFHQPKLHYAYSFRFSLFKEVVEKTLWFAQEDQTNAEAKQKLRASLRRHAVEGDEIIQAMDEGRVLLPRSSGMIDENGDFIPQGVNISLEESTAMEDAREAFSNQYNQHFVVLIEVLYLAKSIQRILNRSDNHLLNNRIEEILSSIHQTSDMNLQVLQALRQVHIQVLKSLPKFSSQNDQEIRKEAAAEVQRFFLRLKNKSLNQIYGFQEIFKHHQVKQQDAFYKEMLWVDLDLMHKGYLKRDAHNKKYMGIDTFGGFARRTLELVRDDFILKQFADVLPEDVLHRILRETFGHFEAAADSFESEVQRKRLHAGENQLEILYLSWVQKRDFVRFMRLADGAGCCISSNKKMELSEGYSRWMAAALNDDGLHGIVIHTRNKPVGFVVWHFAENKQGDLVIPSLRLYLKSAYHSNTTSQNLWMKIQKILAPLGVKKLSISHKTDGLGQTPIPTFFSGSKSVSLSRFQTINSISTAPFDLSDYPANEFGSMFLYSADMAMLSDTASGMIPISRMSAQIEAALKAGEMIQEVPGNLWQEMIIRKIRGELKLLEDTDFTNYMRNVNVRVNVLRPKQDGLSSFGLAVATGKDGQDVYAVSKFSDDENLDVFVSEYGWKSADEDVRREIIAHQLYKAFALNHSRRSSEDFDLELLIDKDIRLAQRWQDLLKEEERDDLGLGENVPPLHLRARAFARLMASPSKEGKGSAYTDFLRMRREAGMKDQLSQASTLDQFDSHDEVPPNGKLVLDSVPERREGGIDLKSIEEHFSIQRDHGVGCKETGQAGSGCIQLSLSPEEVNYLKDHVVWVTSQIVVFEPIVNVINFLGVSGY